MGKYLIKEKRSRAFTDLDDDYLIGYEYFIQMWNTEFFKRFNRDGIVETLIDKQSKGSMTPFKFKGRNRNVQRF